MHLRLGMCACINEPSWEHMNTCACLEAREMRDVDFFFNTTFIEMLRMYFFFYLLFFITLFIYLFWILCHALVLYYYFFYLGMLPRTHLFMGQMFWKPRVGCRIHLIWARDLAGELGLETCFKSQFGANRPG